MLVHLPRVSAPAWPPACPPAHEANDVLNHLVVVLDVGAVGIQRAVGIKSDELQVLRRRVHLRGQREGPQGSSS